MDDAVTLGIIREAVDAVGMDLERDDLLQDVGVDSIAGYEIRLLVRERCGVEVPEEGFEDLGSVGDLLDLVRSQAAEAC
ncbi:acyl carrier protein [Nocardiopsis eucommiae]|uniref:Acyl carrier protein n=2 Tax=Nocardiopsidaceae TaxID=83676 RepID=A0A975QMD1_9ACTN|nr:acyl carrier protein [Nocardiopsis eucommiae]